MDLEEIWRIREEDIYPQLFGERSRGIFVLSHTLFQERFGQVDINPLWLFYGVIEFAPTVERASWMYVTSGHSNPWDSDMEAGTTIGLSGAGVELLLATAKQEEWAIRRLLDLLAFDLLLRNDHFPGKSPLGPGHRVPLRGPINGDEKCLIRNIVITHIEDQWPGFSLPSGNVRFLVLTGATDAEITYAKATSTDRLVEALRARNYCPVTDVSRSSLF